MIKSIRYTLIFFSPIVLFVGYYINSYNLLFVSIMLLFIGNMVYSLELVRNRIIFLLYNVSFFVFLLGGYFFEIIANIIIWDEFPQHVVFHTFFVLFLSLFFIYLGAGFVELLKNSVDDNVGLNQDLYYLNCIRESSKKMFLVTYFLYMLVLMEKVIFVQQNGYVALYIDYKSKIPLIIDKISQTSLTFFYIYLASLPLKKDAMKIILLQLLYLVISILSGVRGQFSVGILMLFAYFLWRDKCLNFYDEKWLGITEKKIIVYSLPFILVFLNAYSSIRVGLKIDNFNMLNEIINFFVSQGGSVKVISYSKLFEEAFPETNVSYVFSPIIHYFNRGTFASIFTGLAPLTDKVDMALYGNNLGATITYLVAPNYYLAGGGLGTQYIAELYADFGYWGVMIFNFLFGIILAVILPTNYRRWWLFTIGLLTCNAFFMMPRNFALTWIGVWYSLTTWLPIVLTYILANRMYMKKERLK